MQAWWRVEVSAGCWRQAFYVSSRTTLWRLPLNAIRLLTIPPQVFLWRFHHSIYTSIYTSIYAGA